MADLGKLGMTADCGDTRPPSMGTMTNGTCHQHHHHNNNNTAMTADLSLGVESGSSTMLMSKYLSHVGQSPIYHRANGGLYSELDFSPAAPIIHRGMPLSGSTAVGVDGDGMCHADNVDQCVAFLNQVLYYSVILTIILGFKY